MRNLAGTTMWTMAAMAVLGLATSVAEAGHYRDIDDHARDIEYQAGRAERIVKYSFRGLPVAIQQCLLTNLHGLEENADCVRDLTRHSGHLDEIVEHVQVMTRQLAEVEEHVAELRTWCCSCVVPSHLRSSCGRMSRDHERSLRELDERVEKICDELRCMTNELNELLAASHHHGHHGHVQVIPQRSVLVPPPVVRRPVQSSVQIGFRSSRRFDDHRGHDDRGGRHGDDRGGRHDDDHDRGSRFGGRDFGHGRTAVSVPLFRHNGRSFGFSLSIR